MHIFNRVKLNTPESVELEFILAGIGSRAWALMIDYLILVITWLVFLISWTILSIQLTNFSQKSVNNIDALGIWLLAIFFIISSLIYAGYFVFFETLWQGQTPGKRVAKIRVVRDDGRPVGLPQACLRAILRPLDEFLFIGAFLIIFTPQEKRLGDLAAGTIVIQSQPSAHSGTLTLSAQAKLFHPNLIQITDLSPLLPDDFAIIREYLLRREKMTPKAKALLSLKLAQQVKAIINLDNLPDNITSDVFLEAIYLAYKQQEF